MKLHRYVKHIYTYIYDHQRLHIVTKDVISLSISVLLLFRHYISHKITFGAPAVAGYYAVLAVLVVTRKSKQARVPAFVWLFRDDATTAKGPGYDEGTNLR